MEESLNLRDYIIKNFGEAKTGLKEYSPLTLAFIGDAVYSLVMRTVVVDRGNMPVNRLHRETSSLVQAGAQAALAEALLPMLTEEEEAVYRRGKNAKTGSSAKNASIHDYHKATGMEALTGYLYLKGDMERIVTLLKTGMELTGQYKK